MTTALPIIGPFLASQAAVSARPTLSILLPTVLERQLLFAKLHYHILRQAKGKPVEVIVACDNKEISIGKKRQNLLEAATGEYIVYIDDDDWVADDYVDSILGALESKPDCVGFLIRCTSGGANPRMAKASLKYKRWGENEDGFAHTRSPYQKTPVRRELALRAGFPDLRYAEDRAYSTKLVPLLKTEEFINKVLYHYRFQNEPFARKYGIPIRTRDYKGRKVL